MKTDKENKRSTGIAHIEQYLEQKLREEVRRREIRAIASALITHYMIVGSDRQLVELLHLHQAVDNEEAIRIWVDKNIPDPIEGTRESFEHVRKAFSNQMQEISDERIALMDWEFDMDQSKMGGSNS
jgi:hypothetical protein